MSLLPPGYQDQIKRAVAHYWKTLESQAKKQDVSRADRGNRTAVTGGKQMDGFCALVQSVIANNGMEESSIFVRGGVELPGYFRPSKRWDLIVVHQSHLVAAIEFKSHAGPSFGNNFNNRTEEAIGSAADIWTAFRDGAFGREPIRPWVGWLMFLEDCEGSAEPVKVTEPHFKVFEDFRGASYAKRYELMLRKLVVEKLYDGAALILSERNLSSLSNYREPAADLTMKRFLAGLGGHVRSFLESV